MAAEVEMGSSCVRSCCKHCDCRLTNMNEIDQSRFIGQLGISDIHELNDRDSSEESEQLDVSDIRELNDRDCSVRMTKIAQISIFIGFNEVNGSLEREVRLEKKEDIHYTDQ